METVLELEILTDTEEKRTEALKQIEDVLEALGYSMKDTTRTSYLSMLMKKDKDGRIFRTRQHLFPSGCPLP